MSLPTSEVAVIAVDLWDSHPNLTTNKLIQSNLEANVLPFLWRIHSSLRVFAFGHGENVSPELEKMGISTEPAWTRWRKMRFWFCTRKLRYFFFIGYASNMCLLNRAVISMPVLNQRAKKLGGGAILVRDCTLVEIPEFRFAAGALRGEWTDATETLIQSCFSIGSTASESIVVVVNPTSAGIPAEN